MVEDETGVGGYILGALDTADFEALLEESWWPELRLRYADPSDKPTAEWSADEHRAWQIHHPRPAPREITQAYPSHLHINLLPRLQGRGVGRRLIDHWLAHMGAMGSNGAHLGVGATNARAMGFYRAYGWRELKLARPSARTVWFGL